MSKIQINNLNNSELEVLNAEATTEVVGGFWYGYGYGYKKVYKSATLTQVNQNSNLQVALGGGKYSSTGNSNSTYQSNYGSISQ
ncbi:hypothetical protein NIES4102_07750 [Chondrocystis sp. NIES-4102]|nr:hypothetical protein NIES4102_07750 [Chondrocystis sp. NIES-4102]